jgi:coenzyme F420-reducing hydrogenase alpha subunit
LGKDSIFNLDKNEEKEHQLLHDTFTIKAAGNELSLVFGGRSVHAPYPMVGGFSHYPNLEEIEKSVNMLKEARPAALRLIEVFNNCGFEYIDRTKFAALHAKDFNFLEGEVFTSDGESYSEDQFPDYLNHVVISHSQASGYTFSGKPFMVGALARLNMNKEKIHEETKKSIGTVLNRFPSTNVFHNNLAQAIEILHCLDESIEILSNKKQYSKEDLAQPTRRDGLGIAVIEAPRGLLVHKYTVRDRKVTNAQIIVPTGMNQISMEKNLKYVVEGNLDKDESTLQFEIEKFIRAFDPCISCATHFLKIRWL